VCVIKLLHAHLLSYEPHDSFDDHRVPRDAAKSEFAKRLFFENLRLTHLTSSLAGGSTATDGALMARAPRVCT